MENESPKKPNNVTVASVFQFAMEFGFMIAVPLILFAFGGKWLDAKSGHAHLYTLLGILLALAVSTGIIARRLYGIRKQMNSNNSDKAQIQRN